MELHLIFPIFFTIFDHFARVTADVPDDFSAVTSFSTLNELYSQVKTLETSRPLNHGSDATLSADVKEDICVSFTASGYALLNGLRPVHMDLIHDNLHSFAEAYPELTLYHKDVLQDYQPVEPSRKRFTYNSRPRFFNVGLRKRTEELSFACIAQEVSSQEFVIFYISEAYDINSVLEGAPTAEPILARFVCKAEQVVCRLAAIAEEPAIAMAPPHFDVENEAYLKYRLVDKLRVVDKAADDPLCQRSKSEKLRICASVLASPYFADKAVFFPKEENVSEQCSLRTVSFKTEQAIKNTKKEAWFNEWMLACSIQPLNPNTDFLNDTIFISRAYFPKFVFVYAYDPSDKLLYILNASAGISPMVEKGVSPVIENQVGFPVHVPQTTSGTTKITGGTESDAMFVDSYNRSSSEIMVK